LIELQLAHAERNQVRAAYNNAQRLPERRKMMQAWVNCLDGLRAGAPGARSSGTPREREHVDLRPDDRKSVVRKLDSIGEAVR
jgi:hypothetical protein